MRCQMVPDLTHPVECNRCSPFCPWFILCSTDRKAAPEEISLADLLYPVAHPALALAGLEL